ncbi:MAG: aspartate--tRNA(Asn) ligase [Candidatus Aenigmatarchaeota archaeon]
MLRTHYTNELKPQTEVTIAGWVQDKRDIGSLMFIILRDFMGTVQITVKKNDVTPEIFETFSKLHKESTIAVEGNCVETNKAPGGVEIIPKSLTVLSSSDPILPIDLFTKDIKTSFDKRLDFRSVDLRRHDNLAIFKIQSTMLQEIQRYLGERKFMQVFTPCLMGVPSEGGSEVFSVLYFKREAFLRQDPQLHRQLTIVGGIEKLYDVGPSWRAEVSHTVRHLCEHRTCAAEMAFIKDEYDVMELEQNMVINVIEGLQKNCEKELKMFDVKFSVPKKFPVLEFPKIYDILEKRGVKIPFGDDYGREGEKVLGEYVKEKFRSDFFFVNRFPFAHKPFYVMRYDDDPQWARSTDLIHSSGIELSSGGQREHRYDKLMEQVNLKSMTPASVSWFTEFFKYGAPPHGGFAIGIERLTMTLLNLPNIREAVLFPRDPERLTP